MNEPDNFDTLLDTALTSYTAGHHRPGLEQRILAGVSASQPSSSRARTSRSYLVWMTAIVAALILCAVLLYPHARPKTVILSQNPPTPVPAAPIASRSALTVRATFHHPLRRRLSSEPAVELPEPTPQERLLTQFVSAHPSEVLAIAEAKAALDRPIEVRPLDIQPIQLQPISNQPIIIDPLRIENLPLDRSHPARF